MKLIIVGSSKPGHMGCYLASAARQLNLEHHILDTGTAYARHRLVQSVFWRIGGKRPARLAQFAASVVDTCKVRRASVVLTTGAAPLTRRHIETLRGLGARVINYSTDDPWNPIVLAPWFLSALPAYDEVFTTRRANLDEFRSCGVRTVSYLPFGYDPEVHKPWPDNRPLGAPSDVLFVGGCDDDRLPMISKLVEAGLSLALFGGYWNRHSATRALWRGIADQKTIRAASAAARVCLCLVRRSNRDSHVMRSFEAAAIGGCILAEDTADHRALFGSNDYAVRYFRTDEELVQEAKYLVAHADVRQRLSTQLRRILVEGRHTYADRLATMLRLRNSMGETSSVQLI